MPTTKDVLYTYNQLKTLNATAKALGVSLVTVRRTLITRGQFVSERSKQVHRLVMMGLTTAQIAQKLNVTEKAVTSHMPYIKGSNILTKTKSRNAEAIARHRARKRAESESTVDNP